MRIVFVGASEVALKTAQFLRDHDHEVVIIDIDRLKIDKVAERIDCSFLHGDGSRPEVLREVGPEQTDLLFCLSGNDQTNIIASLVGRSLGFNRVVTSIRDYDFEPICTELGLSEIIIPSSTISRYLADMATGHVIPEVSTVLRGEARFFSFIVREEQEGKVKALKLPPKALVACYYRNGKFALPDGETKLLAGDEVILLTYQEHLDEMRQRFSDVAVNGEDPPPQEP